MFQYYHSSAFSGGLTYSLTHNQLIKGRNREREDIIYTNLKFSEVTRMSSHCYVCKRNKLNSLLNTESLINCKQRCRLSMVRPCYFEIASVQNDVLHKFWRHNQMLRQNACLLPLKSRLSAFSFCFVYIFLCLMTQIIRVYFSCCLFPLDFSMTIDFIGNV